MRRMGACSVSRAMRVFSYVVMHDSGFAPNPFHGHCTLACCKPKIRSQAKAGDIVIGLTTRSERVVYESERGQTAGIRRILAAVYSPHRTAL